MSNGLISLPPAPASPTGSFVSAGDWFPAIDVNGMRAAYRIGTIVTDARLRTAIAGAIAATMRELAIWQLGHVMLGRVELASVPAQQIDGASRYVEAWHRAVGNAAMAELVETHRDIGATADGALRSEEMALSAHEYRRAFTHAVRDILGVTRTSVALL